MFRAATGRLILALALVLSFPIAVGAQAGADSPEGTEWHLAGYAVEGEVGIVPWYIDATLLLDGGQASGSTGCNRFSGAYELDGESLVFDEALSTTRMACPEEQAAVETSYMANLGLVRAWSIENDVLSLTDGDGAPLLDFEQTVIGLTPSDVAAIELQFMNQQAQLERLDERIDNIRIGTLRDRIKTLESLVATLQQQAAGSSSSSSSGSAFNAAENVLLKGIPQKVRKTCQPLRSGLPSGTAAAVSCDGSRQAVAEQAYYLMEWSDAVATMKSVAGSRGVPNRLPRCHNQKAGWIHYGTNLGAEACWSENGKANYRLIANASACKQLDVAGTQLKQPAIYLAMEGVDNQMEPVRAAGLAYTDAGYLIMNFEAFGSIRAQGQPNSPGCNARIAAAPGL